MCFWTCWDLWSLLRLVGGLFLCMFVCNWQVEALQRRSITRRYISNEELVTWWLCTVCCSAADCTNWFLCLLTFFTFFAFNYFAILLFWELHGTFPTLAVGGAVAQFEGLGTAGPVPVSRRQTGTGSAHLFHFFLLSIILLSFFFGSFMEHFLL